MKYLLFLILLFPLHVHAYGADDVLKSVNKEREVPLVMNEKLNLAAQAKANALARCQCFSHVVEGKKAWSLIQATGYSYRMAGENLAVDFTNTRAMTKAWMQSPGHRANILNTNYKETGIALAKGRLDGHNTIFVVQLFANP